MFMLVCTVILVALDQYSIEAQDVFLLAVLFQLMAYAEKQDERHDGP